MAVGTPITFSSAEDKGPMFEPLRGLPTEYPQYGHSMESLMRSSGSEGAFVGASGGIGLAEMPRAFPQYGRSIWNVAKPTESGCACGGKFNGACDGNCECRPSPGGCGSNGGGFGGGGTEPPGHGIPDPGISDPGIPDPGIPDPGIPDRGIPVKECCIRLICRSVKGLPGVHCAIEKISCDGDRVVYELLVDRPDVKDKNVSQPGKNEPNDPSLVYAIRDPNYAAGKDKRYKLEFSVCYPCELNPHGELVDPLACRCVMDTGAINNIGSYPKRRRSQYRPRLPARWSVPEFVVDSVSGRSPFGPNSNSFAKYYLHRCTKKRHLPKAPKDAFGWDFEFGKGPDYPSPWGGVFNAEGEIYYHSRGRR